MIGLLQEPGEEVWFYHWQRAQGRCTAGHIHASEH